jgi:hypothetical protein
LGGNIIDTGSSVVTEYGVFWSQYAIFNPSDANKIYNTGSWTDVGVFSMPVSGLPAGLLIYYRPYALNSFGI